MNKELLKAMSEWLAIDRQDQERLAEIRQELARLGAVVTTQLDTLDVDLY